MMVWNRSFSRAKRGGFFFNRRRYKRPGACNKLCDVLAQNSKVYIPDSYSFPEDRIVHARHGKKFFREAGKDKVCQRQFCAEACQLTELLRCEIGLNVILEGSDQIRDLCNHGWAEDLIA